jgi:NADH:ubiquinone oxidoreductase subunit 3 (subunit A)
MVRVALVFLVFDAAVVLLVPVAAVLRRWVSEGMALRAVAELTVFVLVLSLALAYAWKKGDLDA